MSATSSSSAGDPQPLIDLRLDAIDRALLGLLPRSERLEMVAQIETRLRELGPALAARDEQLAADIEHSSLDADLSAGSSVDGEIATALKHSRLAGRMNLSRRRPRSRLCSHRECLGSWRCRCWSCFRLRLSSAACWSRVHPS